jgi:coproporphyrinogen III oxidase-like Fe-S oxidoreductase
MGNEKRSIPFCQNKCCFVKTISLFLRGSLGYTEINDFIVGIRENMILNIEIISHPKR